MDEHTGVEHPRRPKQVIVMRKDLNMRKGKMIAQGAHASLKAIMQQQHENATMYSKQWCIKGTPYEAWMNGLFAKIVVSVDSEEELDDIFNKARAAMLAVTMITDSGKTEFNGVPTKTCLCIGPAWSEDVDKITGHLKLL